MAEKIDWYKVSVLSWARKNQRIYWEDHVKAGALAMARETAKRIRLKEVLALAKKALAKAKSKAPEVEDKTQEKEGGLCRMLKHVEYRALC